MKLVEVGEQPENTLGCSPPRVAVRHGEDVGGFCSPASASRAAVLRVFAASGAVMGPVLGLRETSAFMIVCLGMSVDFAFFRCVRKGFGNERGFGTGTVG